MLANIVQPRANRVNWPHPISRARAGPVKALSDRTDLLNRGGGQSQGGGGASCSDLVVDEKLPTHLRGARFFTRFEVEEAHAALRRGDLGSADGGALPVGMNDQIVRAARAQTLLHALLWNAPS